jgi:hypothetical protein
METETIAHVLPELYRALLARVALLELDDARREADLIRAEAIRAYSTAWDDRARRRIEQLTRRADRVLQGVDRPRTAPAGLPRLRRTTA